MMIVKTIGLALAALVLAAEPALAHHVMGGKTPVTFGEGLLSGLGHPIIGLDHLAAVIAVGCLAATQRVGAWLAIGYVVAMMIGAAAHIGEATVPGAEIFVAVSVIALGAVPVAQDAAAARHRTSRCLPSPGWCTAMRWANRLRAPSARRSTPISSGSSLIQSAIVLPRHGGSAAVDARASRRRAGSSAAPLPVRPWSFWIQVIAAA